MKMAIDQRLLAHQTFDDPDLAREVLAMFAAQTPEIMRALLAVSGPARADLAHRIKGSALAIGATDLAEVASALENQPADEALLRQTEAEVAVAMGEIVKLIGAAGSWTA